MEGPFGKYWVKLKGFEGVGGEMVISGSNMNGKGKEGSVFVILDHSFEWSGYTTVTLPNPNPK